MCIQVASEFILESERESFIEQVREVIENADEKGLERDVEKQVWIPLSPQPSTLSCVYLEVFFSFQKFIIFSLFVCICDLAYLQMAGDMEQQIPAISVPMPGKDPAELKVKCGESWP